MDIRRQNSLITLPHCCLRVILTILKKYLNKINKYFNIVDGRGREVEP
ncbi:hypothetical protein SAMN05216187_10953 [Jeotgalicoccus aerolatus]|uniref:Uncharacterized protein n=1 Tax=Jeotgalicoccus aerolatus TaxID=709510 RepID=A0A1G9C8U5_9STAP|nr:hypothetical protein SAMN05216187_10953 [Jeotgalicoccus aerolatus]